MVKKIIIKHLDERAESFVISDSKYDYEIRKADLNSITLGIGDEVTIIDHPNFPGIVAGFDLNGHRVFHKSREEVVDEYMHNIEKRMFMCLPLIAKERIKMFEMFVEDFGVCDRLQEILALSLGYKLFSDNDSEEAIDAFARLSFDDQTMILPEISHPLLPQIPAEMIVEYAKAYLQDERNKLDGTNRYDLLTSSLMRLPNATAEKHREFCVEREVYIARYLRNTKQ